MSTLTTAVALYYRWMNRNVHTPHTYWLMRLRWLFFFFLILHFPHCHKYLFDCKGTCWPSLYVKNKKGTVLYPFSNRIPNLLYSLLEKVFYCTDFFSAFPGQYSFAPPMLAASHHAIVFIVDSSWVFDRLLSSATGWRKPPRDVPWVRKQGGKGEKC